MYILQMLKPENDFKLCQSHQQRKKVFFINYLNQAQAHFNQSEII